MRTDLTDSNATQSATSSAQVTDDRRMSITGHLEELRRRLWACILTVLIASAVSFSFADTLIGWLRQPGGSSLGRLAFFSPPEAILAYVKVAVVSGLIFSMPLLLYELWAFVSAGLDSKEKKYGFAFVWWGSFLFSAGAAFAYWVLLPISLAFLLNFGGGQLEPVISINKYLAFVTMVILACGAVFQLPLAVFILARLGIVNAHTLRRRWRFAVLGMVIVAALITPTTDVATMLLLTLPMLILYEISTWIAAVASRKRRNDG